MLGRAETGRMREAEDGTNDLTDALLGCARGEQTALRRIFDLEAGRLLGVAQRMLRRRDLAEEAVQDTFVQIWRKASQFRAGESSPAGWIFAILRNRCLNILRDGGRLSMLDAPSLAALQESRRDAAPAEAWDGLGDRSQLRSCLEGLEPTTRHSILLAYVAGFTHGEIAAMQDVPLGTAKSWIRRGLIALRDCLS